MMHQDRRCRSRRPQLRPHKVRCCPRASRRRCRTNARVLARTNPVSAPRAVPACSYDGLGQPPSLPSSKVVLALGFPCSKKGTKVQKCTRSCRLSSLIQVSACRLLLQFAGILARSDLFFSPDSSRCQWRVPAAEAPARRQARRIGQHGPGAPRKCFW